MDPTFAFAPVPKPKSRRRGAGASYVWSAPVVIAAWPADALRVAGFDFSS